ncbi:single-stranded DNA-binding protein [Spirosoma jeollabukense]
MFGLNKFVGIGHVGSTRVFNDSLSQPLTAISIGLDDSYKTKDTQELVSKTIWVECVVKGDRTETYSKGRLMLVEGKVTAEAYTDKDGKPAASIKIKNARVKVLDKKSVSQESEEEFVDDEYSS